MDPSLQHSSVPNDQPYFDLDALCSPEAYIQLTSDLMLDPLQSHATVHASSAEQGDVELWDEWCYNGGGVDFCNWENLLSSLAQNEYQSSTLATPLVYYTTASTSSNGISNIQDAATPTVSTYTATVPDIQDAVTPTVSTFPVTIPENQDAATPSVSDIQDEATPAIRKNFTCSFCKKTHDRQDRLESCENGHKGRKPHICGGKCGDPDCTKKYQSKFTLGRHTLPTELRYKQCEKCNERYPIQNIARHKKGCDGRHM